MKFEQGGLPSDLNPAGNKPAAKHREAARKREEEDNEVENLERRKALKYGVMAGLGLLGFNMLKGKKEEEPDEFGKQMESIKNDLSFIKKELSKPENESGISDFYRMRLNGELDSWNEDFNSLSKDLEKEKSQAGIGVILSRLEELGKKISIERLGLESKFKL